MTYNSYERYTDTKGLLTVAGEGTLRVYDHYTSVSEINGLWLGRDGTGTLEVVGTKATCSLLNLVMTNGYVNSKGDLVTSGQPNLRIVSDANGPGKVTVSQKLYLAPNATLEVDMSAYTGPRKKTIKIVDCASRVGAFAPENVKTTRCRLVTKENDPDLYVETFWPQGFAAVLR